MVADMIFDEIFTARSVICLCLIASGLVYMNGKILHHRSRESRIIKIYKIVVVSTVLTNVKTCFVVLVGILIRHSPCLNYEKQFLFMLIYFCRTPAQLFRQPPPIPPSDLFDTVKSMFFKIGVFLVITRCKKQNVRFLVSCAVSGRLLVVCSRFLWLVVV